MRADCLLHEVKNCLAAVKGNLALLRSQDLPETARAPMDRLERVSRVLERLATEDPLPAGAEADRGADLGAVVAQCRSDHFPSLAGCIQVRNRSSVRVRGQAWMFGQVFLNLFRNALEADATNIRVDIRSTPSRVRVVLEDDGCGCPREALPRLFEPGYTSKRGKGGTGMGLFLVKVLVESHGGSVRASRRERGDGSSLGMRFLLDFPAGRVHPDAPRKPSDSASSPVTTWAAIADPSVSPSGVT